MTSEDDWNAAIGAATARWGGLDILVNNAGMFLGKGIEEASLDEWDRLCAVNLTGVFLGTKLAVPSLRERAKASPHGSAIVNLASVAGLVGSQLDPLYSMTKGGVTLFTKSAALEFARKGYRIRLNSIHPGVIQTDMGQQTFVSRARNIGTNDVDAARQIALSTHPIGRLGIPTDIANGIVFLASEDTPFGIAGHPPPVKSALEAGEAERQDIRSKPIEEITPDGYAPRIASTSWTPSSSPPVSMR